MNCKKVTDFTINEATEFLQSFDNILIDFDGVICIVRKLIPGANDAINKLRSIGKTVRIVTNNSIHSFDDFERLFHRLGIQAEKCEIINQTRTIVQYLKSINFQKELFVICSDNARDFYKSEGFKIYEIPHKCKVTIETITETLTTIKSCTNIGAVLMDITFDITYEQFLTVQFLLSRPDVLFLVGSYDKVLPVAPGVTLIGPATFADVLAEYTGRKPIIFGKPSEKLKDFIYKDLNIVDPKRTLFVGDSLLSDMQFSSDCGFQKLLVLSGITKEDSLNDCSDELCPDYVANSLKDIATLIEKLGLNTSV